jgi:hypothetical protein
MFIAATDPAVTYTDGRVKAGRLWLDTSTGTIGTLKKRNAANDGWDTLADFDAATVPDDSITNAKLANMAQSTIKGRASGAGTGDPTDLTGTQATVILDAMVGDSGSGGTKGLVPAPGAGDTAAGKFLKADGTFAVPPGTGVSSTEDVQDIVGAMLTDSGTIDFSYDDGAGTETAIVKDASIDAAKLASASVNAQTGTTYTLQASDNNKVVTCSNGSGITVTVPSGLGAGFSCLVVQIGAGQVTFSPSSTTINNRQSHTKIAGQYGVASLVAYASNVFALGGDTAS